MATIGKLLVLITLILTSIGMTAPAVAGAPHHGSAVTMSMQHCPEQAPRHAMKGGFAECTMGCSAALPAVDQSPSLPAPIACECVRPSLALQLSDLHPDIATPPPKYS